MYIILDRIKGLILDSPFEKFEYFLWSMIPNSNIFLKH